MLVSTYSICACDLEARQWGVAVQSRVLAVGCIVPWAEPLAGAIATQSWANPRYGPDGLALLREGLTAADVVGAADRGRRRPRAAAARRGGRRGQRRHLHRRGRARSGREVAPARATLPRATSSSRARPSTRSPRRSSRPRGSRSPSASSTAWTRRRKRAATAAASSRPRCSSSGPSRGTRACPTSSSTSASTTTSDRSPSCVACSGSTRRSLPYGTRATRRGGGRSEDRRRAGRGVRASGPGGGRGERASRVHQRALDPARPVPRRDAPVAVRERGGRARGRAAAVARDDLQVGGRPHRPRRRQVGRRRRPEREVGGTLRGHGSVRRRLRRRVHHRRGRERGDTRPACGAAIDRARDRAHRRGGRRWQPARGDGARCLPRARRRAPRSHGELRAGWTDRRRAGPRQRRVPSRPARARGGSASRGDGHQPRAGGPRRRRARRGRGRGRRRASTWPATPSRRVRSAACSTTRRSRVSVARSWPGRRTTSSSTSIVMRRC